ncbi:hypothetical protein DFH07DRAFT_778733 [Mycena maculata]|uniref:Uncharacterized protein n=1 Tax=Mycena maculata TaxID=230809 RepID=A0AAD7IBN1_9AGAR|nr:hypothetical protein DFH07DRAFT_778733 [Mycena maculata]
MPTLLPGWFLQVKDMYHHQSLYYLSHDSMVGDMYVPAQFGQCVWNIGLENKDLDNACMALQLGRHTFHTESVAPIREDGIQDAENVRLSTETAQVNNHTNHSTMKDRTIDVMSKISPVLLIHGEINGIQSSLLNGIKWWMNKRARAGNADGIKRRSAAAGGAVGILLRRRSHKRCFRRWRGVLILVGELAVSEPKHKSTPAQVTQVNPPKFKLHWQRKSFCQVNLIFIYE